MAEADVRWLQRLDNDCRVLWVSWRSRGWFRPLNSPWTELAAVERCPGGPGCEWHQRFAGCGAGGRGEGSAQTRQSSIERIHRTDRDRHPWSSGGSDIDLCLEAPALGLGELLLLGAQLDDLLLPWRIDLPGQGCCCGSSQGSESPKGSCTPKATSL